MMATQNTNTLTDSSAEHVTAGMAVNNVTPALAASHLGNQAVKSHCCYTSDKS